MAELGYGPLETIAAYLRVYSLIWTRVQPQLPEKVGRDVCLLFDRTSGVVQAVLAMEGTYPAYLGL